MCVGGGGVCAPARARVCVCVCVCARTRTCVCVCVCVWGGGGLFVIVCAREVDMTRRTLNFRIQESNKLWLFKVKKH